MKLFRCFLAMLLLALVGSSYAQNNTKQYSAKAQSAKRSNAQPIKIACIGNSVTAGYLLPNPATDSYSAQLQALLGNGYQVGNFGFSGATLLRKGHRPYAKTEEFKKALAFGADVAIIHLGLNDTDPRNWPDYKGEFQTDYQWLIDTLKQVNPKVQLYICKLSPIFSGHPRFKSGTRDWYWQIQEKIEAIAQANELPVIDLNAALGNRPDLFGDNLHPDRRGASILAQEVYQQVTGDFGGVRLNPLFTDHMVLQRRQPIAIYGTANAGQVVEVKLNNQTHRGQTDRNGQWRVTLPAMEHSSKPIQLHITAGKYKKTISDILIGDVWLCSGQSNMAFPLRSAATGTATLAQLKDLPIRLLKFKVLAETDDVAWDQRTLDSLNELKYFSGSWALPSQNNLSSFSAVAYYFGEKLATDTQVPIGLIQLAVGGSTQESWMDRRTLEDDNLLVDQLNNWRQSDFMQPWARGRSNANLKNASNQKQRHPYEPAYNYEAGVAKVANFPIKGVIWYQGESNADHVEIYKHAFPLLVKSWRKVWGPELPFYYVQLSSINRPSWPYFRNAQRELESLVPNTGMAVTSDLGDSLDVHPRKKKEVGERLALLALANTYQQPITSRGPAIQKAIRKGDQIVLHFSQAKELQSQGNATLTGFELEDKKGNHTNVKATVVQNQVHLTIPTNVQPVKVLYGWQPFTRANLINEAQLPASTFSIDIN